MSVEKALGVIDDLLSVLDEADKLAAASSGSSAAVTYFADVEGISEKQHVRVTSDFAILSKEWEEAEMGPNGKPNFSRSLRICARSSFVFFLFFSYTLKKNILDELKGLLGNVGMVVEIEEDDDTVQVQWGNFDTCWLPAKACSDAGKDELTIPGVDNGWLLATGDDDAADEEEKKEEAGAGGGSTELPPDGTLFKTVDDVKTGITVRVTRSLDILQKQWEEAELGPHDNLATFCGCVGTVVEVEEDDDTVQLEWQNLDTCWMPVGATYVK